MLERLKDLPPGIIGVKAIGKVTKEDYEQTLVPLLDEARREGERVRFLYQFGPEFDRFSAGGAMQDARVGLRSMRLFEGCAIVSDVGWIRKASQLFGFWMPCAVRVFSDEDRDEAADWLATLPEGGRVTHRLIPDRGVIVVEATGGPLRVEDFDALSITADAWIEAHGRLHGLVIHAREFPGWETMGSLVRHIRFVRDHHRKVLRVALATDGKLASLAPRIADHFVEAKVEQFAFDALERAIAWAGAASEPEERT